MFVPVAAAKRFGWTYRMFVLTGLPRKRSAPSAALCSFFTVSDVGTSAATVTNGIAVLAARLDLACGILQRRATLYAQGHKLYFFF